MSRLIIVSNRLPYSIDRDGDKVSLRQSSGGLVSAIKSYFEHPDHSNDFSEKIWVGGADFEQEDWQLIQDQMEQQEFSIQPIFIEPGLYSDFYNGFSNSVLWPLFHYFPSLATFKKEYFDAYVEVNRQFSQQIIQLYQPGDVIWIHDYQLMLLPQMVRLNRTEATIGFFLHIPFPSYELFRLLPGEWKKSILKGLMGADLVGFHAFDYVQHFIHSVKMLLKIDNSYTTLLYQHRLVKADIFPIGIDFAKFYEATNNHRIQEIRNEIRKNFYDKKIIFSVDRLDYTKGLMYRLEGFERFLEKYPDAHEQVLFVLNVVPSRDTIPTYNDMKRLIEEKVSTINGRFSTLSWQPVLYRYNHMPFEELCAMYQVADVALITPLRDGMNLVAKEYIASCSAARGVLVLSELAGAASELSESILVNPTDVEEVADAVSAALQMPVNEQRSRVLAMQKRIRDYDVNRWTNDFLEQLFQVKKEQKKIQIKILDEASINRLRTAYQSAKKRCILLDYDGTLAPFQKHPTQASPGNELIDLLIKLSADPQNHLAIISGRDAPTLEKWLGNLPITLVAEHGAHIKEPGKSWHTLATVPDSWKDDIRPILELFVTRCAGSFIEEKQHTLAWHYRNTMQEFGFTRSRELINAISQMAQNTPIQVIDGNKVVEIRLTGVDKGITAHRIVADFNPDFVLCMGDDTTDEDMFKALENKGYTIKIGNGNTAAQYSLLAQDAVLPLLQHISDVKILHQNTSYVITHA